MPQAELCLVVTGITVAGRQEIVHDKQTGAGCDLTVECCHIITGVIVVVATQTTQLALQHAQWRHLNTRHTHVHTEPSLCVITAYLYNITYKQNVYV